MDSHERLRIQSMLNSLTPLQQEQIKLQISSYQANLVSQRLTSDKIAVAVYEFWKTMVTIVYNNSAGRTALTNPAVSQRRSVYESTAGGFGGPVSRPPPPPPPAAKAHPLAVCSPYSSVPPYTGKQAFRQATVPQHVKLVDKSEGLLSSLMNGVTPPVGLQDWVNRVYLAVEKNAPGQTQFADGFVANTIKSASTSGELWRTNWVGFPLPTARDISRTNAWRPDDVIDLVDEARPRKVRKGEEVEPQQERNAPEEFISFSGNKKKVALSTRKQIAKTPTVVQPTVVQKEELNKRQQRAQKYKEHLHSESSTNQSSEEPGAVSVAYEFGNDEEDVFEKTDQYAVVGLCTKREKRYLRLTSAPDPALVRPEPVLRDWLSELEKVWESRAKEWKYIEDQMRAIRQDLTVQNLRGELTVKVYELNARWALESGDIGQFNQCQTQLKQLHNDSTPLDVKCEFLSYRLLYYYLQNLRVDEQIFLNTIFANVQLSNHPCMQFALEVRTAATTNNFSKYFRLAKMANGAIACGAELRPASHAKFLLRAFEAQQRMFALLVLTKAFVTQITVGWLTDVLGFASDEECREFLTAQGALMKQQGAIDPRASHAVFARCPLLVSNKLNLMG